MCHLSVTFAVFLILSRFGKMWVSQQYILEAEEGYGALLILLFA
jgi:hypothetical protein